jgi:uncharacterized protein (DUF433 family)
MLDLTTSEVAALFDLDERRVRKDVEYGVIGRTESPPRFELAEVVYFCMMAASSFDLRVEDRKKLYRQIASALSAKKPPREVELGAYFVMRLDSAVHDIEARLDDFARWKQKLVETEDILGGEPVFPRSRLAVRQIGEMARRGASASEILEDYPYLTEQDVEFAKRFAAAYPRLGRPRAREAPAR